MTELQELRRFLRVVYLRKSLYYSVLILLFSVVAVIALAVYNHYYIPDLVRFRKVVGILLLLTIAVFIFWPVRYFIQGIWSRYYSLKQLASRLRYYDEGRLKEIADLSNEALDLWAQNIVLKKVHHKIPGFKKELYKNLPLTVVSGAFALLLALVICSPKALLKESKREIIDGTFSRASILLDPLDSIHTPFNEVLKLSHPLLTPFYKGTMTSELKIIKNESIDWELNGRFYKSQKIICDSIPKLISWSARIAPPEYLNLYSYSTQDTIKAFKGSRVTISYQGVLKDKIKVSRETNGKSFVWKGKPIELTTDYWTKVIPTVLIEDLPPIISVFENNNDSLTLIVNDDHGILSIELEDKRIISEGVSSTIKLAWNSNTKVTIKATDKNSGVSKREIRRPSLSATQLSINAADHSLKKAVAENKKESLKQFREQNKLEDLLSEDLRKEVLKEESYLEKELSKREPLDKLLERLDELWRMEEAIELLGKVDSLRNEELDSALMTAAEALNKLNHKETKESADLIKNIDKEGKVREEQAKEASKKLKELLVNSVAEVQEDNVARIKRLLKNGWVVSVFQESLQELSLAVNKARSQQTVLANEAAIKDSLDLLLIHEPKLNQALSDKRAVLEQALRSLELKLISGKDIKADIGYTVTALNDINQVLYFLLESEKSNLNQAKKNCKKGKPGSSGKPASAGKGKEGKKGLPKPSKKPGGREKGKSGDPKNGEKGTKPGSTGKPGEKELLKRIEAASKALEQSGQRLGKNNDKLKRMKEDLLFNNQKSTEDLNELEERLWRVEKSVFNKKELGETRDSESADETSSQDGETIDFKVLESKETDLPLPVLKKR